MQLLNANECSILFLQSLPASHGSSDQLDGLSKSAYERRISRLEDEKKELMLLKSKLLAWNFWHRGCCQPQSKLTQTWDGNDASRRGGTTRYKSVTDEIVFDPGNFGAFSFWNASPDLSLRGVRSSAAQRVRMPTPHISAAPGDFAEATAARPRHLSRRWQDAHSGSAI